MSKLRFTKKTIESRRRAKELGYVCNLYGWWAYQVHSPQVKKTDLWFRHPFLRLRAKKLHQAAGAILA